MTILPVVASWCGKCGSDSVKHWRKITGYLHGSSFFFYCLTELFGGRLICCYNICRRDERCYICGSGRGFRGMNFKCRRPSSFQSDIQSGSSSQHATGLYASLPLVSNNWYLCPFTLISQKLCPLLDDMKIND